MFANSFAKGTNLLLANVFQAFFSSPVWWCAICCLPLALRWGMGLFGFLDELFETPLPSAFVMYNFSQLLVLCPYGLERWDNVTNPLGTHVGEMWRSKHRCDSWWTHDQTISACNVVAYVLWLVHPGGNCNVLFWALFAMRFRCLRKKRLLNVSCLPGFEAGPSKDALRLDCKRTRTCWNPLC